LQIDPASPHAKQSIDAIGNWQHAVFKQAL